jgi:hypothetical protein
MSTNPNDEILASVENLVRFFGFIFAVAVGEAFKQFVAETDNKVVAEADKKGTKTKIQPHWNRFPALLALIFLIVPFFHGMGRLFYKWYHGDNLPYNYAFGLLVDFFVCTTLAALFVLLSRSLAPDHWKQFYGTVCVILAIDFVWIEIFHRDQTEMTNWAWINLPTFILLLGVWKGDKFADMVAKKTAPWRVASWLSKFAIWLRDIHQAVENEKGRYLCFLYILATVMLIRTVCDYAFDIRFYFPSSSCSRVTSDMR